MAPRTKTKKPRTAAQLANDERLRSLRANPGVALAASEGATNELGDDALGIGEEDDAAFEDRIGRMVDAAVEARLKAMGISSKDATPGSDSQQAAVFAAFLERFEHLVEVRDEQRPGYIKPLTAAEVDARNQGKADMFALLRQYKADHVWPTYLLADEANPFYGPGPSGPMLYQAGQEIRTRLPPAESFQPVDEPAIKVYEAYKRWIGEPVSLEELTRQAVIAAMEGPAIPEMAPEFATADPQVQVVDKPQRDVGPKRVLGTVHPELRGKAMPKQPGVTQQPTGPVFVGEA